jgi:hypothetical protein
MQTVGSGTAVAAAERLSSIESEKSRCYFINAAVQEMPHGILRRNDD